MILRSPPVEAIIFGAVPSRHDTRGEPRLRKTRGNHRFCRLFRFRLFRPCYSVRVYAHPQNCHPDRSGPTFSFAPPSGASGREVEGSAFSALLCELCVLCGLCASFFLPPCLPRHPLRPRLPRPPGTLYILFHSFTISLFYSSSLSPQLPLHRSRCISRHPAPRKSLRLLASRAIYKEQVHPFRSTACPGGAFAPPGG